MPLYLLYASKAYERNSSGRNAVLVSAADEAEARALTQPDGETRIAPEWTAVQLAASVGGAFPAAGYVWFRGEVDRPLLPGRGQ